jgi:hypothetical protein
MTMKNIKTISKSYMKKYIIIAIGLIIFGLAYYLTGSWKISLLAVGFVAIYLIWTIGFELGFFDYKQRLRDFDEDFESIKNKHIKDTENNPTLR